MTVRPSLWIFAPAGLALIVFAAYGLLWNAGAGEMRKAVASWADDVRDGGGAASFGRFRATGFPFLLRGVVSDVSVTGGGWTWSAPALYIDASPFGGNRAILSVRAPHILQIGAARFRIDAPDGRASIAPDATRGWLIDVQSGPGRIENIGAGGAVSAQSFLLSAAPNAVNDRRIFFGIDARGIAVEGGGRAVSVDSAELAFAIDGLLSARSLREWRDAGGRVDVQRARFATGGAHAEVSGRLVLDADGYPSGSLATEIANPAAIVETLSAAGLVSRDEAAKAAAGLTLAAIAGGGKIAAPLTLDNGAAKIAGVRLGGLPRTLRPDKAQP